MSHTLYALHGPGSVFTLPGFSVFFNFKAKGLFYYKSPTHIADHLKLLFMRTIILTLFIFFFLFACGNKVQQQNIAPRLNIEKSEAGFDLLTNNQKLLSQVAKADFRPYLHPIMAPDGNGALTQYSPGHHKHQTGLYWGFTRINGAKANPDSLLRFFYNPKKTAEQQALVGRDFFHHPGAGYWKKLDAQILTAEGDKVKWMTSYHMLDEDGEALIKENQSWTAELREGQLILDLDWQAEALREVRIGAFDYGGMFLRMPWHQGIAGAAVNDEGKKNQEAEGQRAKWVDVGMEIKGRKDWGHIVMMDHPNNTNYPTAWRVDGQLGVGPCRAIHGDWTIDKGNTERIRYRLLVYTGKMDTDAISSIASELAP